jgi:hypothetical protein
MNNLPRRLLFVALFLILLLGACSMPAETTGTPIGTIIATEQITDTALPTSTSAGTATPFIPITGMDVVSLQCQFCVNDEAHAVLIMSSEVSFNVSEPATGIICATAEEINGRRILLCRGAQQVSFNLNVCVDASNCLQFPVTLQSCPLIPQTGSGTGSPLITFTPRSPIFLTAINTLIPPPSGPRSPTETGVAPPTSATTSTPVVTSTTPLPTTPVPTEVTPQPTEPAPTQPPSTQPLSTEPPPTAEPSEDPTGNKKPSKTPKT